MTGLVACWVYSLVLKNYHTAMTRTYKNPQDLLSAHNYDSNRNDCWYDCLKPSHRAATNNIGPLPPTSNKKEENM